MAWVHLVIAGIFEIGWAFALKFSEGFSRLWPSVATVACMGLSMVFVSQALKTIPIGTTYAVWTGIGAAGTALVGMLVFGEPATAARLLSIGLIIAGIAGLKLF
ncbi:quaternary ammonium compound efflux SMR transporter SugE [Geobacter sp. DSM 9736]|uniref:quaternary ammonium compound efflux SMR transporter SugE n=1 Tax=Geobacter sp. DSM 9736 TaxID=1277350 RepID=UPI000B5044D5|nr:quaternary ammonium compound efflux SMR transporter SugE [Geobacter sp. DSM 9736]SNB46874.1 quaternary ammonium compound-resistance protein SugE [Geobacter sp. DSM 9736]